MTDPIIHHQPGFYRIKVGGRLEETWKDWFHGMTMTYEEGHTLLTGPVADQAALHGLLVRIRDLNLPLILLERIETTPEKKT